MPLHVLSTRTRRWKRITKWLASTRSVGIEMTVSSRYDWWRQHNFYPYTSSTTCSEIFLWRTEWPLGIGLLVTQCLHYLTRALNFNSNKPALLRETCRDSNWTITWCSVTFGEFCDDIKSYRVAPFLVNLCRLVANGIKLWETKSFKITFCLFTRWLVSSL